MANLGSLFYSLYLKDMTDDDIPKIKAKLEKELNIKIGVDVSEKAVDEVLNKLREKGKEITKNRVVQQETDKAEQTSRDIILKQLEREGRMWADIQAKKEKAMQPVNQALSYSRIQSAISLPYESASYQNAQNQLRAYYQEQERLAKSAQRVSEQAQKAQQTADNRRINDLIRITSAIQRADNAMQRLSLHSKIGGIAGPKTEQGIEQLRQYISMLERAKSSSAGMTNALNSIRSGSLTAAINQANRLATEQGRLNAEKNRALALETRHKAALDRTNASMRTQDGLVSSLRNQMANVYSIYTLERFATQLIEIGGEFQKQHIALQSILGDGAKADAMFSKIKNLAIESPFTFQQLAGYTKQLAAFQIPYEELYDTTKRLADVSAGLGVDMGRIILAYGQVRSAAFLRGQEVRQFTEAGIPLLDELAKKFSQLENRVVSVGEVFDKISNREVPFAMVKEVFTDLTNEGGKFYNMQAKLSDSLSGKLAKLKDAYQIMLADIAQANNDLLGGGVDMVRVLTEHWRELLPVLTGVIGAYGAYKTAILLVNAAQKASLAINTAAEIMNRARAIAHLTSLTKLAAASQYALNAAMSVNPLYLFAAAIGVVIGGIVAYTMSIDDATDALDEHNKKVQEQIDKMEEEKNKASQYISTMFNATKTIDQKKRAYENLNGIYPSLFKNMTYEQALLKGEIELQNMATKAAREKAISQSKTNLQEAYSNLFKAEMEMKDAKLYSVSSEGDLMETEKLKKARERLEVARQIVEQAKKEYTFYLSANREIEKSIKERWFVESMTIAGKTGSLAPRENEGREAYFKRIGEVIDELNGKINALNKKSKQAQEVLPGYTSELSKAKKIYEDALGGAPRKEKGVDKTDPTAEKYKNEIALLKELYSEYKKYVDLQGKEKALNTVKSDSRFKALFDNGLDINNIGEYIKNNIIPKLNPNVKKQKEVIDSGLKLGVEIDTDGLKKDTAKVLKDIQKYIDDTTKKWDLYKTLFEATGDKTYSMEVAFSDSVHWDSVALDMRKKLEESMKAAGISVSIDFTETEEKAKDIFGSEDSALYKLWEETKKRIEKNGIDLKVNAANAIKEVQSISDKIKSIENQRDEELMGYTAGTPEYDAIAEKWNNEILELKNSLLETSPAFEKLFADTTGMSINQIENLRKEAQRLIDLINTTKTPVLDSNGAVKGYKYTKGDGEEGYISKENYDEVTKRLEKLGKKSGQVQISFKRMWDWISGSKQGDGTTLKFRDIAEDLSLIAQEASDASGELGSMFDSIGNESLGDAFSIAGDMLGSVSRIASGVASGNPFAVIGGISSGIASIAQLHDKKLDKAIERSKQRVEELKNAYDNLNDSVERFGGTGTRAVEQQLALYEQLNEQVQRSGSSLSTSYSTVYEVLKNSGMYAEHLKEQIKSGELTARKLSKFFGTNVKVFSVEVDKEALKALEDVGVGGTEALKTYQAQYVSLVAQRRELEGQLRDEESKKKSDSGKIADYQQQINELNGQIRYFIEDLAKELYAIDFDDWEGQISDALTNAFANGKDAALAFDDAVNNIMKNVANSILKNLVIAPMMEKLQQKLFGDENGNGGVFKSFEDLNNNTELAASTIKDFFDTEGNAMLDASQKFLEAFDKATGGALAATGESDTSGLSKEIQGVTEDTANKVGSYLNSMRQDVSVKRMLQEKFFNEEFPKMSVIAQAQLRQLNAIAENTRRMAESNDAILEEISELRDDVHSAKQSKDRGFYFH